jgi:hypothetical protein
MWGRVEVEFVCRRVVSAIDGGCGWGCEEDSLAGFGILIRLSPSIDSCSMRCFSLSRLRGNSLRDNSLGNLSLGSSALLIGMFKTASANRLYSCSGSARMTCVIQVAKPAGVKAGTVGFSCGFS